MEQDENPAPAPLGKDSPARVLFLPQEGYAEISVNSGVFLRDEAEAFQAALDRALREGYSRILLNFNACQYISSWGLGCVADYWRRCNESPGRRLCVLFNDKPVNELLSFFEVIGLARMMSGHLFTNRDKALHRLTEA